MLVVLEEELSHWRRGGVERTRYRTKTLPAMPAATPAACCCTCLSLLLLELVQQQQHSLLCNPLPPRATSPTLPAEHPHCPALGFVSVLEDQRLRGVFMVILICFLPMTDFLDTKNYFRFLFKRVHGCILHIWLHELAIDVSYIRSFHCYIQYDNER